MKIYRIEHELAIPAEANPRFGIPGIHELDRYSGWNRCTGGDKGDLLFDGYDMIDGRTVLLNPAFRTVFDDLTDQEVFDLACEVLRQAFESVGTDCVM